jgi:hypothetical protein
VTGIRLKASTFRSYISVLADDGRAQAVMERVPPETAAIMADPPLASSWVDFRHIVHITVAVEALAGLGGVREFTRKATDRARKPHVRLVEGVVKLFGTSPATLYKRMNEVVRSTIEGLEYRYTPTSDHSGVMEMIYGVDYEVPMCMLVGAMPTLQVILEVCGVEGLIGPPERLAPNRVRFAIRW